MMPFKVGQQLFDIVVDDAGHCEMQVWEVRTVRGGKVTAIQRNKWTWCKLSSKNGDYGWAKSIDPLWRKTWPQQQMPSGLSLTRKAAWKSILKDAKSGRLNYIEPEAAAKCEATARRQCK